MNDVDIDSKLKDAVSALDFTAPATITSLCKLLDDLAKELALSHDLREQLGHSKNSIWVSLRKLWRDLCRAQLSFWDEDDDEDEFVQRKAEQRDELLRKLCLSIARFTRNLVAGVPENQTKAFEFEPQVRQLLHYHTSWTALKDQGSVHLARILTQTLSNLVTGNEALLQSLWETYLQLSEDQVVLIRLLSSSEPRIIMPTLILILNLLNGSRERLKLLCKTPIGIRIMVCLLDDMVLLFEADDASDGAQAFDSGYAIFTFIAQENFVGDLYSKLSMPEEIITPQQIILLKLLDSYLQSIRHETENSTEGQSSSKINSKLSPMLARSFFSLSGYAHDAMSRAIGNRTPTTPSNPQASSIDEEKSLPPLSNDTNAAPPAELDVMLPKVCEALVLVTQCMVTIALEGEILANESDDDLTKSPKQNPKAYFNEARLNKLGLVESLIETLRILDFFLPRINFGKPVPDPSKGQQTEQPESENGSVGFLYVKRDLVRLLGVLCHGEKAIQDRVRECGGIQVVLNLCVVDERNPYLREHAIFTLHNLLEANQENQKVVDELQPKDQVVATPGSSSDGSN